MEDAFDPHPPFPIYSYRMRNIERAYDMNTRQVPGRYIIYMDNPFWYREFHRFFFVPKIENQDQPIFGKSEDYFPRNIVCLAVKNALISAKN